MEKLAPAIKFWEAREQLPASRDFFRALRDEYPIDLIYYPGSGNDTVLLQVFPRFSIVMLDDLRRNAQQGENAQYSYDHLDNRFLRHVIQTDKYPFIMGDYRNSPFADETFDAIVFSDNHADSEGFQEMLRTLKKGGLIIVGDTHRDDKVKILTQNDIANWPGLHRVNLAFGFKKQNGVEYFVMQKD